MLNMPNRVYQPDANRINHEKYYSILVGRAKRELWDISM